jgi:NAD(P)-dependent dehydrogenase (short-subunit alcohol dehydrogenase family)
MAIRTIRDTTVVVTGATSGIGRVTALEFHRAGARVVAAGRRQSRLDELVDEIEGDGGQALAVATDVAKSTQVKRLIESAVEHFGGIDTLVNNAGVGIFGRFDEQSLKDFRRVMDVNFWGAVYACKEAIPVMKEQPKGGLIVNVSSILGKRGVPFETAYCASKFALAGFTEALRAELASDRIDVTGVYPGAVESEIWQSAANRTGREMPAFFPKLPARQLAKTLVRNARFPRAEIVMSLDAQALDFFNRLAPGMMDLAMGASARLIGEGSSDAENETEDAGNLYRPRE